MKMLLKIDPKVDPKWFTLEKGWEVVEAEERTRGLTELDIRKIKLLRPATDLSRWVWGEQRLSDLRDDTQHLRLGAAVVRAMFEQEMYPEDWEQPYCGRTQFVCFDGTVLQHRRTGKRRVPVFYAEKGGIYASQMPMDKERFGSMPSAVIEA